METTNVVLYQNGKAKIQADSVEELVTLLYKGIRVQKSLGRRFLKLGTTAKVSVPTKGDQWLDLQKLSASAFNEDEMLEIVKYLNA